jgi:hypothetical protein
MIDITAPSDVEVKIRGDGKVVWVNIDGICKLRACRIGKLELVDERQIMKKDSEGNPYDPRLEPSAPDTEAEKLYKKTKK